MLIIMIVGLFTGASYAIGIPLLIVMLAGIQLVCTGILGLYLSKAYTEIKARPIYLVKETEDGKV